MHLPPLLGLGKAKFKGFVPVCNVLISILLACGWLVDLKTGATLYPFWPSNLILVSRLKWPKIVKKHIFSGAGGKNIVGQPIQKHSKYDRIQIRPARSDFLRYQKSGHNQNIEESPKIVHIKSSRKSKMTCMVLRKRSGVLEIEDVISRFTKVKKFGGSLFCRRLLCYLKIYLM